MWTISKHAKSNFLLKPFDIKGLGIILMSISSVSGNKWAISCTELILTSLVWKVESLQVLHKYIFCYFFYSCNVTTLILRLGWNEILCCSMSHHFLSPCSVLGTYCFVMVTLNPKYKVSSSLYHFFIYLLIIIKLF